MTDVSKLIRQAKTEIVVDLPFFSAILLRKPLEGTTRIPTAAVDQYGKIYINPKFMAQHNRQEVVFILCHEILHWASGHHTRYGGKEYDKKVMNRAQDAWINAILEDAKVGTMPESAVTWKDALKKTVPQIYKEMMEQPQNQPDEHMDDVIQSDGEDGEDGEDGSGGSTPQEIEADRMATVAQAAAIAKATGNLPGALEQFSDQATRVTTPWYDRLEPYFQGMHSSELTWARPNKRYAAIDLYQPSVGHEPAISNIVAQIDVSGSISKEEAALYLGHIRRIIEQTGPAKLHLLWVDTNVQKSEIVNFDMERGGGARAREDAADDFTPKMYLSGGGTDMTAGFEFVREKGIEADLHIVFTDGYTPWGNSDMSDCPVVWVITTEGKKAPWGESFDAE